MLAFPNDLPRTSFKTTQIDSFAVATDNNTWVYATGSMELFCTNLVSTFVSKNCW